MLFKGFYQTVIYSEENPHVFLKEHILFNIAQETELYYKCKKNKAKLFIAFYMMYKLLTGLNILNAFFYWF